MAESRLFPILYFTFRKGSTTAPRVARLFEGFRTRRFIVILSSGMVGIPPLFDSWKGRWYLFNEETLEILARTLVSEKEKIELVSALPGEFNP